MAKNLFKEMIEGLTEYYPQLKDKETVKKIKKQVTIPDTGNTQDDYMCLRDQIEKLLQRNVCLGKFKISEKELYTRIINKIPSNMFNDIIRRIIIDLKRKK